MLPLRTGLAAPSLDFLYPISVPHRSFIKRSVLCPRTPRPTTAHRNPKDGPNTKLQNK